MRMFSARHGLPLALGSAPRGVASPGSRRVDCVEVERDKPKFLFERHKDASRPAGYLPRTSQTCDVYVFPVWMRQSAPHRALC